MRRVRFEMPAPPHRRLQARPLACCLRYDCCTKLTYFYLGGLDMSKGYRTYRGRSRGRFFLPLFAVILLLVAAIVLFFLGLQDYIVFTSDGLRFINPFDNGASSESPSPDPSGDPALLIVTPENPQPRSPHPPHHPEQNLKLKSNIYPRLLRFHIDRRR